MISPGFLRMRLLFLKRLSDVSEEQKNNLVKEHVEEIGTLLADDPDQYQFFVPAARWEEIRKHAEDIGSAINVAFESLENENTTLEGVLTPIVFNRYGQAGEAALKC
jgi:type I restriction enzyme M protein